MSRPTVDELRELVGEDAHGAEDWKKAAAQVLKIIETYVRVYTRGNGFDSLLEPNDDLAAVILSASARLIANTGVDYTWTIDDATSRKGSFSGWTLPELAVLHSYRRRTA